MHRRASLPGWLKLLLLLLLPGAACGLLPLLTAARVEQANSPARFSSGGQPYAGARIAVSGWLDGGRAFSVTATPFQPVANTPTLPPPPVPTVEVHHTIQQNTPQPTPTLEPTPVSPSTWHGIDLHDGSAPLRLVVDAPEDVNHGMPLVIGFQVGRPCEYADHRACISAHAGGRLLLATVHSGVGGEGQSLRHALEGTGLNRAGLSLERIQQNLSAMQGAPVSAEQNYGASADNLRVLAVGRVPASAVAAYFALPFDEALALAGIDLADELENAQAGSGGLLVIETCGWRHADENWAPGVSDTTGSVYLMVVGE